MKEYYEFKRVYDEVETVIKTPHVDGNIFELTEQYESFLRALGFMESSIRAVLKDRPE